MSVFLFLFNVVLCGEYRSLSGYGNNINDPILGSNYQLFKRLNYQYISYKNNIDSISETLPNARIISNAFSQIPINTQFGDNFTPLSGIASMWAMLLTREFCNTHNQDWMNFTEYLPIDVPPCDWYHDPTCLNNKVFPFYRSIHDYETNQFNNSQNVRTPINTGNSFIDGNFIYGLTEEMGNQTRTFKNGKLIAGNFNFSNAMELVTALYGSNETFKFYNDMNIYQAGYPTKDGTTSCPFHSIQPTNSGLPNLYVEDLLKTLFRLEHNRICDEIIANNTSLNDEMIFQMAREYVIAIIQKITFTEYVPIVLAVSPLNNWPRNISGYKPETDPTTSDLFCIIGMKYSHYTQTDSIPFGGWINENGKPIYGGQPSSILSKINLRDSYTKPCSGIDIIGEDRYIDSLLSGLVLSQQNEGNSLKSIESLRSFVDISLLATINQTQNTDKEQLKYWDMIAIDIMRARDYGIPTYNNLRRMFGLDPITHWNNLTSNEGYLEILPQLYNTVDDLEGYVGAFLEDVVASNPNTPQGSIFLGSIVSKIIIDQLIRSARGDRFFYYFNDTLRSYTDGVTLKDIILRNTNLNDFPTDVFHSNANDYGGEINTENLLFASFFEGKLNITWSISDPNIDTEIKDKPFIHFEMSLRIPPGSRKGWMGIGFGQGQYMQGKDIAKLMWDTDENPTRFWGEDSYSLVWAPVDDRDLGGRNDLYDITGMFIDDILTMTFNRPLEQNDIVFDFPITDGLQEFIIGFNTRNDVNGKHGTTDRTPGRIDFTTAAFFVIDPSSFDFRVQFYHGITMIILYMFTYPTSAFIARYLRHNKWWLEVHKTIGGFGFMTSITSAYFAFSTQPTSQFSTHGIMGIIVSFMLVIQVSGGTFTNYWLINYKRGRIYRYMHYTHALWALSINSISPYVMYLGWNRLFGDTNSIFDNPFTFYFFPLLMLIIGELYKNFWAKYCSKNREQEVFKTGYHVYNWDEIGEKVSAGSQWLIIGKYIYDVQNWKFSHPGGRRILMDYLGTDCSGLFFGTEAFGETHGGRTYKHSEWAKKQMAKLIVAEVPPSIKAKSVKNLNDQLNASTGGFQRDFTRRGILRRETLQFDDESGDDAELLDEILDEVGNDDKKMDGNITDYNNDTDNDNNAIQNDNDKLIKVKSNNGDEMITSMSEQDIDKLVIDFGADNDNNDTNQNDNNNQRKPNALELQNLKLPRNNSKTNNSGPKSPRSITNNDYQLIRKAARYINDAKKFKVIKLISKTRISQAGCQRPVYLLEFDFKWIKYNNKGDYILLHYIDTETISRAYTPVNPKFVSVNNGECYDIWRTNGAINEFNCLDKIFQSGEVTIKTKSIEERLFLMVRVYKYGKMSQTLSKLAINTTLRFTGPFKRQEILPPIDTDYGFGKECWRNVIMICGGTGITPMLNLIYNQLNNGNENNKLSLLWFNRSTYDIFCEDHLLYYKKKYPKRLFIDFIFSQTNDLSKKEEINNDVFIDDLNQWSRVWTKKLQPNQVLQFIRYFFKYGRPIKTNAISNDDNKVNDSNNDTSDDNKNNENNDDNKNDTNAGNNEITSNIDDEKDSNVNDDELTELNQFDRIVFSGPKIFIETFISWMNDANDFKKLNIAKQTICLD